MGPTTHMLNHGVASCWPPSLQLSPPLLSFAPPRLCVGNSTTQFSPFSWGYHTESFSFLCSLSWPAGFFPQPENILGSSLTRNHVSLPGRPFQLTAAAAAKSVQSCPTPWDPIDSSPPGSPVPGILQARTLEWVAISFSSAWKWKVNVKSLSHVRLFATPWTAAYQAPPSMGFSRQEYWSGVPLPSLFQLTVLHKISLEGL